jgi:ribosomal protein S18 acetylase RimI-like enzyme
VASSEPTPPLRFRFGTTDEIPALVALIQSAYRGAESRRGWTTEADLLDGWRTDAESVNGIITAPRSHMLVGESGGQMIACCQLQARPPACAYLGMLAVRPGLQGGGVGRALVIEAERGAHLEWGATQMQMQVIRQRESLIAWYERLGYRRNGETAPFPYDAPGIIAKRDDLEFVVLVKSLT